MSEARVVAFSDLHIDGGRHGTTNPATGLNTAWESTARIAKSIADYAIEHEVDAVVTPGDLYLNGWPRPEAVELLFDFFRNLSAAGIDVVVSPGNHELINLPRGHRSPIEHFRDLAHVHVMTGPGVVTLESGLQIATFPWPTRTSLLAPGDTDGKTAPEIDALVAQRAVYQIARLAEQVDVRRGPAMLAGHATIGDCVIGSSKRGSEMDLAELFAEPVIPLEALDVDPWQHVAMGHIHTRQIIGGEGASGRVWFCGSPDRDTFTDEREAKAFSDIRLADNGSIASVASIATPARRFVTLPLPEGLDPAYAVDLLSLEADGAIVRVVLPPGSDDALGAEVRRVIGLTGAHVVQVERPLPPRNDSERVVAEEGIRPLEGLDLWMPAQGIADDDAARLREKAAVLVEETGVAA